MKIRALHLEDDPADAFLVKSMLEKNGLEIEIAPARSAEEYSATLEKEPLDVILCDNGLPGFDGGLALKLAREKRPNVPFIIVSGSRDQQLAVDRLKGGASAYVLKSELSELPDAVCRAMRTNISVTETTHLQWHNEAMERLVVAVQELSMARTLDAVMTIVRRAARELTGADGATFVLRDGDQCHYADENAISPLWKGQRFPMSACVSGWAMLNKEAAVIPDIYADDRIPADAYRPTFVKSLVMVPIRTASPIGAIGNYWAEPHLATEEEVELLQALANTTAVALENVQLYAQLEQRVENRTARLEAANRELEAFSYSVSHDLQAPIRAISGFTELLRKHSEGKLDEAATRYFGKIVGETRRMNDLITDLLRLAKFSRVDLESRKVDLTGLVQGIAESLHHSDSDRKALIQIEDGMVADGDPGMLRIVIENLLSNAWKYTSKREETVIEFFSEKRANHRVFCVRDNGVGFDMAFAERLFAPFQRMHRQEDFPGSGVGLATVQRIVHRHAGRIWAEAQPGQGAAFFFSLPENEAE